MDRTRDDPRPLQRDVLLQEAQELLLRRRHVDRAAEAPVSEARGAVVLPDIERKKNNVGEDNTGGGGVQGWKIWRI
jgi:hypothetical protein